MDTAMRLVRLSCGTEVPAEVLDRLAHAWLDPYVTKQTARAVLRKLDKEGKLLNQLEGVLGWTPPS